MKLTLQVVCCILILECVYARRLSKLVLEPACTLKPEIGPCKAGLERYYYDNDEGKCKTFNYGGCEGNGNNFLDEDDCLKVCTHKATEPEKINVDICSLPRNRGPCEALIERYYYNKKTKQCQQFLYGGCQGNENNFKTSEECEKSCKNNYFSKIKRNRFQKFIDSNIEPTSKFERELVKLYETIVKKSEFISTVCLLPRVTGPCYASISRYYYNPKTKLCQNFLYGGCLGNANNFETLEECEGKCIEEDESFE